MEDAEAVQSRDPGSKTILVVEDDDNIREFFELILQREGFNVVTAVDGVIALEKVAIKIPDLIILDFMMPKKGGFEVLKDLQAGSAAAVPVIVATARKLDAQLIGQIRSEANVKEYFTKPIQHTAFVGAIHKILSTQPLKKADEEESGGFGRKRGW